MNRALDPRWLAAPDADVARRRPRSASSRPHESAHLHVAGAAPYVDDLPELAGTLHAALGLSPVAHGRLLAVDIARIARRCPASSPCSPPPTSPGRTTAARSSTTTRSSPSGEVHYLGQPVFAVIADDARRRAARRRAGQGGAAHRAAAGRCSRRSRRMPRAATCCRRCTCERGDARARDRRARRIASPARSRSAARSSSISKARSPTRCRARTTACWCTARPSIRARCSTWWRTALGLRSHQVQVECRRMGGGFGGKESQSALFACVAAIAAKKLGRPVKLRLDRDDDFMVTGRRHCFHYEYEVGYDDDGRILGAELTMVSRAGFSADLSGPVMTRAICHFDNAYWLPDVAIHGYSGTHQHPEQHRLPRLRRAAGRDRDREHPRLDRAQARQGPARRPPAQLLRPEPGRRRPGRAQRHALRPGGRGQRRPRARRRARGDQRLPGATRSRSPRSTPAARC